MKNRFGKATTDEKALMGAMILLLTANTHFGVQAKELKGEKSRVKYIADLKKNNPHIHSLEFGCSNGEIRNIRLLIARPTIKSEFMKALAKGKGTLECKVSYAGVVVHFEATKETAPEILAHIAKLAKASEVIELKSDRTYCDPPAFWIDGNDGRQGIVKKVKKVVTKAPEAKKEEVDPAKTAEAVAKEDIKKTGTK